MSPMMRRLVVMCAMIAVAPTASAGAQEEGQGQRPHEQRIESWSKFASEAYWNVALEQ